MALSKYLRHLKYRRARESAKSGLATSAALPNSGVAFAENSRAASAAIVELTQALDDALEQFDFGSEPSDQVQLQLERLGQEASKYSNSQLPEDIGTEWKCTSYEAHIIAAANACSTVVYDPDKQPEVPGLQFERLAYLNPSKVGPAKATGIWEVKQIGNANHYGPFIILAIKGTAGALDAMVNLNAEKRDIDFFLDGQTLQKGDANEPLKCHAGFLSSAQAILPALSKRLEDLIGGSSGIRHILLTGHSAGGAVASLLFAHFLSKTAPEYESIRFSLVTFGSAPVTNIDLTPDLLRLRKERANPGLILAIVNELDTVVRADRSYLLSLIHLYRSASNRSPLEEQTKTHRADAAAFPNSHDNFTDQEPLDLNKLSIVAAPKPVWPVPSPEYHLIGEIIVLKMSLAGHIQGDVEASSQLTLKAIKIQPDELAKLVFWSTEVHSRVHYAKRVLMILDGMFNGSTGWKDDGTTDGWLDVEEVRNRQEIEGLMRGRDTIGI